MEKDNKLMDLLKRADLPELEYRVAECWDIEDQKRSGLSDLEYLIREAEWVLEDFTEDTGHCLHDAYIDAKYLIKRTKDGKRRPIDISTMSVMAGFRDADIQRARNLLSEVRRTRAFIRKLRSML